MSNQLKVDEIKALLDTAGVEYNDKATKAELQELLDETQPKQEEPQQEYTVVHDFKDLEDGSRVYFKGDTYPHKNAKKPTAKRIKELSTIKNKLKKVLITEQS